MFNLNSDLPPGSKCQLDFSKEILNDYHFIFGLFLYTMNIFRWMVQWRSAQEYS